MCKAIFEIGPNFLWTSKKDEWLVISKKIEERWNFPNVLEATDEKHFVTELPINFESHYCNYKGTDSTILLAMVGPEYKLLHVTIAINGRISDKSVHYKIPLEKMNLIFQNRLHYPGRENKVPYVCTGDDFFPLSTYMMKLFPKINHTKEIKVFNCRLCKKSWISENGFGIPANRWRVWRWPFALEPEKVKMITFVLIILQNWLRSESSLRWYLIFPLAYSMAKTSTPVKFTRDFGDLNPLPLTCILFQILVTEIVRVTRLQLWGKNTWLALWM